MPRVMSEARSTFSLQHSGTSFLASSSSRQPPLTYCKGRDNNPLWVNKVSQGPSGRRICPRKISQQHKQPGIGQTQRTQTKPYQQGFFWLVCSSKREHKQLTKTAPAHITQEITAAHEFSQQFTNKISRYELYHLYDSVFH